MDFNDYSTPVKSFFDDRASFYLLPTSTKVTKVYAKLNKAILDDDYLKIKSPTTKEFFSVDRIQSDIGSFAYDSVAQVGILLDPNKDTYKRTVFYDFGFVRNCRWSFWAPFISLRFYCWNGIDSDFVFLCF